MDIPIYDYEEFDVFVDGILNIIDSTFPRNKITKKDVASCIAIVGIDIVKRLAEDLNIVIDADNERVYVKSIPSIPGYARKKIKFFWEILREMNNEKHKL